MIASTLGINTEQNLIEIQRLLNIKKQQNQIIDNIKLELLKYMSNEMNQYLSNGNYVLVSHILGVDVDFLLKLHENLRINHPNALIFLSSEEIRDENTSNIKKKTKTKVAIEKPNFDIPIFLNSQTIGPFVIGCNKEILLSVKDEVLSTIQGRGGGRPGLLQGNANNLENIETIRSILKNISPI
jgi:alanyl-tRNA synthetase